MSFMAFLHFIPGRPVQERTNVTLQTGSPLGVGTRDGVQRQARDDQVAAQDTPNATRTVLVVEKLHVGVEVSCDSHGTCHKEDITAHVNFKEVGVAEGSEAPDGACVGRVE